MCADISSRNPLQSRESVLVLFIICRHQNAWLRCLYSLKVMLRSHRKERDFNCLLTLRSEIEFLIIFHSCGPEANQIDQFLARGLKNEDLSIAFDTPSKSKIGLQTKIRERKQLLLSIGGLPKNRTLDFVVIG